MEGKEGKKERPEKGRKERMKAITGFLFWAALGLNSDTNYLLTQLK